LNTVWNKLKERGIPQRLGIFIAGSWVALQVIDFFSHRYNWPDAIFDILLISLAGLIPFLFIMNWYQGKTSLKFFLLSANTVAILLTIFFSVVRQESAKSNALSSRRNEHSAASQNTSNAKAYQYFLKAKFFLNLSDNISQIDSAIKYAEACIQSDGQFALAHAMLSQGYSRRSFYADPTGPWAEKAYVESETSLLLDSTLAYGYFARGFASWAPLHKFPFEDCVREYVKAIQLDPNFDEAYNQLGLVLAHQGFCTEAIGLMTKAIKLNPANDIAKSNITRAYFFNHEYQRVVDEFKRVPPSLYNVSYRTSQQAMSLIHLGEYYKAEQIMAKALARNKNDIPMNGAMAVLKAIQHDEKASHNFIRIAETGVPHAIGHYHHVAYDLGVAYALLHEREKAMYWLEWAAENGFPCATAFGHDTLLKDMNGYPPFVKLLADLQASRNKFQPFVSSALSSLKPKE